MPFSALTAEQIAALASRRGVRTIAVENFLGTLDARIGAPGNLINLRADARCYRWNLETRLVIGEGIGLAFGMLPMPVETDNRHE